jgi:hypothetical protein
MSDDRRDAGYVGGNGSQSCKGSREVTRRRLYIERPSPARESVVCSVRLHKMREAHLIPSYGGRDPAVISLKTATGNNTEYRHIYIYIYIYIYIQEALQSSCRLSLDVEHTSFRFRNIFTGAGNATNSEVVPAND